MRELSLFTGAGGGLLGTQLLGWQHVGYVEHNDYRQRLLRQRIDDGILDTAPIFGDIQTFNREGYAASYSGMVDVITAGFPCQPFSRMGKRKSGDDHRNMWPATAECIRIIRPRFTLLENVANLIATGYLGTIIADLDTLGYVANGIVFPLAPSAPLTAATAYGVMLPTPLKSDWSKTNFKYETTLRRRAERTTGHGSLPEWLTWKTRISGYPNPAFCEHVMAWPIGWSELKPLAMARYQQWRQRHGNS